MNKEVERVQAHCKKVNLPSIVVFETAYMWRFGRHTNIDNEVRRYRQHGIVPIYMIEYLNSQESQLDVVANQARRVC